MVILGGTLPNSGVPSHVVLMKVIWTLLKFDATVRDGTCASERHNGTRTLILMSDVKVKSGTELGARAAMIKLASCRRATPSGITLTAIFALRRVVSFQITVLKVLAGHPNGCLSVDDLKRAVAILISSGPDWTNRTKRPGTRSGTRHLQPGFCHSR